MSTQTTEPQEVSSQTMSADKYIENMQGNVSYDEKTLAEFLKKVEPLLSRLVYWLEFSLKGYPKSHHNVIFTNNLLIKTFLSFGAVLLSDAIL